MLMKNVMSILELNSAFLIKTSQNEKNTSTPTPNAGVLKEWFVQPLLDPDYYSNITEETDNEWKKKHGGINVRESVKEYLVKYLGEPLQKLLR